MITMNCNTKLIAYSTLQQCIMLLNNKVSFNTHNTLKIE